MLFCPLAIAEYMEEGPMDERKMQERMEMKREIMLKKEQANMQMGKNLVATTDGGVVILIGNKLLKYDANLNLIKEIEIKIEKPDMPKIPTKKRPMMNEEMERRKDKI